MRQLAILVALAVGCGGPGNGAAPIPPQTYPREEAAPVPEPTIALLVGSWSRYYSTSNDGQHEWQLDIHEDGTFARADYYGGAHDCTATGKAELVTRRNVYQEIDERYLVLTFDTNTCYDVGDSIPRTEEQQLSEDGTFGSAYTKVPGPQVGPELVGVNHRRERRAPWDAHKVASTSSSTTSTQPKAAEDPRIAQLKNRANQVAASLLENGYWRTDNDKYVWTSSKWTATPLVKADTKYMFGVLAIGADAHATLEMNGKTLTMDVLPGADDVGITSLMQYATIGHGGYKPIADGGLGISYTGSSDSVSLLMVFEQR